MKAHKNKYIKLTVNVSQELHAELSTVQKGLYKAFLKIGLGDRKPSLTDAMLTALRVGIRSLKESNEKFNAE